MWWHGGRGRRQGQGLALLVWREQDSPSPCSLLVWLFISELVFGLLRRGALQPPRLQGSGRCADGYVTDQGNHMRGNDDRRNERQQSRDGGKLGVTRTSGGRPRKCPAAYSCTHTNTPQYNEIRTQHGNQRGRIAPELPRAIPAHGTRDPLAYLTIRSQTPEFSKGVA
eukprot:scaffold46177_cov34-Tisochrysis_lutea.AAC.5